MKRLRVTRRQFLAAPRHSHFHADRLRLLITSITFVLVSYFTIGCKPPDPQPVRDCFDRYKQALLNKRGEEAVELVDSSTLSYYASLKDAALNAKQQEVRNMTMLDKFSVLWFRHELGAEQLQRLSERELFISLVDQGWIEPESAANGELGQVSISGDTAEGEFISGGKWTSAKYRFVKEGGVWRMNLPSLMPYVEQGLRTIFMSTELSEDKFVEGMLKEASGKTVPKDIWEPLVKE